MRNIRFKLWTPYLTTGSKFYKTVYVTLDPITGYNIYKFQIDHLKNKRNLRHRKSKKSKVFRRLLEVDESISGRHIFFSDTTKETL